MMKKVKSTEAKVPCIGPLFPLQLSQKTYSSADVNSIFMSLKNTPQETERITTKGRSLIATQDIKQGELIFAETMFSKRVPASMLDKICNYTLSSPTLSNLLDPTASTKLQKETRSNQAWFKEKTALADAWKEGHKEHVEGYAYMKKRDLPVLGNKPLMDSVYFCGQVYLAVERHHKAKTGKDKQIYELYCPFDTEMGLEQEEHFTAAVIVTKYLQLNADLYFEHKLKFITRLMSALQRNCFSIQPLFTATLPIPLPEEGTAYTLGLYSGDSSRVNSWNVMEENASKLNAFYTFDIGGTNSIHWFASKDIKRGEELITAYTAYDDAVLAQAVTLQKYKIFSPEKNEDVLSQVEKVLTFELEDSEVEVRQFAAEVAEDMEDFDVQLITTEEGAKKVMLYIRAGSTEVDGDYFKDEQNVRDFIDSLSNRKHIVALPDYYLVNLECHYTNLVSELTEYKPAEQDIDDVIEKVKTYLKRYLMNPQMKNLVYPFYYLKKYDLFMLLSTIEGFQTKSTEKAKAIAQEWSAELLEKLGPVMKASGQFGKIAIRELETALQQG